MKREEFRNKWPMGDFMRADLDALLSASRAEAFAKCVKIAEVKRDSRRDGWDVALDIAEEIRTAAKAARSPGEAGKEM